MDRLLKANKGEYSIVEKIATGGMAVVYRAYDIVNDRKVALKHFPNADEIGAIAMTSFKKELESLQRMKHDSVITLLDHGFDSKNLPFLVLELMDFNLVEYRTDGNSDAFEGYDDYFDLLGQPILNALAFAHSRNITHRDVKPKNILVSQQGTVKLADFGIAKLKGYISGTKTLREFRTKPFSPPEADIGEYSDARDVYAFGALTVWALTEMDRPFADHERLYSALNDIDVHPKIKAILEKALSTNPADRYDNAVTLKGAIDSFLRERKQLKEDKNREKVTLRLSGKAQEFLRTHFGGDDGKQKSAAELDINDAATLSVWTYQNEPVKLQYAVVGSKLQFHIVYDEGQNGFVVIGIDDPPFAVLQNRKQHQAPSPVEFTFKRLGNFMAPIDALDKIDSTIRSYTPDESQDDECHPTFRKWRSVLNAKKSLEEARTPPVSYSELSISGNHVAAIVSKPELFEVGSRWSVKSGTYNVGLEVTYINDQEIDFVWKSSSNQKRLPAFGVMSIDIHATLAGIERQQAALDSLINEQSVRSDLSALLANPEKVSAPRPGLIELDLAEGDLDDSKQEAIKAALSSEDVLLIHGPPGTGKTRFIAFLIDAITRNQNEEKANAEIRNPVLLVSQTHVAIDHALEKVSEIAPELKLLRISSTGDVATQAKDFLMENQLQIWKEQVAQQSDEWVRKLASDRDVDPQNVFNGCKILEYLGERKQNQQLSDRMTETVEQIGDFPEELELGGSEEADLKVLKDREKRLKSDKKESDSDLSKLQKEVVKLLDGDDSFVIEPDEDVRSLAQDFLGDSESDKMVKNLMELRSDWILKFGKGESFNSAISERADVVAGTCVGFIGLKGINDVVFDWCIIDEASKATVAESLVPMVRAKKWIFVGDSKQLPPFSEFSMSNADILEENGITPDDLSRSLFPDLEEALPDSNQRRLIHQYRMCRPIGKLIASCFYPGNLEPGNREADNEIVKQFGKPVLWVSTSAFHDRKEKRYGTSWVNSREVLIIQQQLDKLFKKNDGKKLKVLLLSSYMAQVRALQKAVDTRISSWGNHEVVCSTIDAVQGQQANVVIYSLTRTPPTSFVDDKHRVNVALSRPEDLLMVVGDLKAVKESRQCEQLKKVARYIEQNKNDCKVVEHLLGSTV